MVKRLRESIENTYYEVECAFDKKGGKITPFTIFVNEVNANRKPKDSLKVEGGFLVNRKYFDTEEEANDYADSMKGREYYQITDESVAKGNKSRITESVSDIESALEEIEKYLHYINVFSNDKDQVTQGNIDYIRDNLDSADSWRHDAVIKQVESALKDYQTAMKYLNSAEQSLGQASNYLFNSIPK